MGPDGEQVSVSRVIPAPSEAIFALVADASRHPEIDGSGTVRQLKPGGPERLQLGSRFGMSMKMGISYSMENEVVEFEPNRRIAWQARPAGLLKNLVGGRIWRYELEPVEGGTRVTETWDISQDRQKRFLKKGKLAEQTRRNMERTLERIEQLVTGRS
jgi:uncharacterized protein YndB with AHSA1/START domain